MLGGGVFVTQNKVLPGAYINVVSTASVSSSLGERGTVAIALSLNKSAGTVIELTKTDFANKCEEILGVKADSDTATPLRELFCHANKVYIYDLGEDTSVSDVVTAFEAYEFNVLCAYTEASDETLAYVTAVKNWRDNMGKKCQVVVYDEMKSHNHEGVIQVASKLVSDDAYKLTAWVAGAEAGCKINESCTNMLYDGEYDIDTVKTQAELETHITKGELVFHLVYGEVRILEDINSLTTTTEDKNDDFKSNQTIRIIDQVANDIAKLFNTKYLGKIPNNASGRVSLWADIVSHHKEMEAIQAIENFDPQLLTVEQGSTKKSIVVNDCVAPINAMGQLYMTIFVQ